MNKKIIVFSNTSWFLVNFNLNLMLKLQTSGYEVIALAPEDKYSSRFAEHNITFLPISIDNKGTNPIKDFSLFIRLVLLFLKQHPAVILSYTPKCNIYAGLAAKVLNIPIIQNISGLGAAFIREDWVTQVVKWLYRLALKKSSRVFLLNKDDLEIFLDNKLVPVELAGLLPGPGVDTQYFSPTLNTIKKDKFVFLLVSRMLKDKGVGEFVDAARLLKKQYPQIECQLLGFLDSINPSAVSASEMQAWVDEEVVNYLGVTDNVIEFLHQSDCVVLPSYYREGVPRCLLEAASVAKPVITTNNVGCREVVDDGVNGFLCEVKNHLDLKDKMEKMFLLSEVERLKMGENGRQKMIAEFDESIVINKYLHLVNTLVEQQA